MSAAIGAYGWIDVPATAIREIQRAKSVEKHAEAKSVTFRTIVKASAPRWGAAFMGAVSRRAADFVLKRLHRMSDELVSRAAVFEKLQEQAIEHVLGAEFGQPTDLLGLIESFRKVNAVVIDQCRLNADLLRGLHPESRVATAFDRLSASACLLGETVDHFVPILEDARAGATVLDELRQMSASFDRRLNDAGDDFELDEHVARMTESALKRMSERATLDQS